MKSKLKHFRIIRRLAAWFTLVLPITAGASAAGAHPHTFITVKSTVLFAKGAIAGLHEEWTFDEFYSEDSTDGLDTNKDGKVDRQELAALTKTNIDGLTEFNYFIEVKYGKQALKLTPPTNYFMEMKGKFLTLEFDIALEKPVEIRGFPFTFEVADTSIFIAFPVAEKDPVRLGDGAPSGCKATLPVPANEDEKWQSQLSSPVTITCAE